MFFAAGLLQSSVYAHAESLQPLKNGEAPQTVDEAWAGYDPTVEPIEAEVIKEWKEDGVVLRAVRYCIGTFKGQKAWMGALYGFPEGGQHLPGLVQIHGGGGSANKGPCIDNAKRGYATISLSWRADPRYLKTYDLPEAAQTDWGLVEGKQVAESRGIDANNDKRYDPVPSARNGGYFLRTLAARRALTFLAEQPEVDGDKLGVYGHSMGGVITLQTAAIDPRVVAAAPSCAPPIDLEDTLKARTYSASAYASKFHCPILWMSPANDFHGRVEDMEWMMSQSPRNDFRIARSEHYNHKHNNSCLAANELWFDAHLKQGYDFPDRPEIRVVLETADKRPQVQVLADSGQLIDRVEVYFTRDAKHSEYNPVKARFWQFAKTEKKATGFVASLDLVDLEEPLWVFANVHYRLDDHQLSKEADTMTSTSRMIMLGAEELQAAGIKADGQTTLVIEDFDEDWQNEWTGSGGRWESFRLNDARVPIPDFSQLVVELADKNAQLTLMVGDNAVGTYNAKAKVLDGKASLLSF